MLWFRYAAGYFSAIDPTRRWCGIALVIIGLAVVAKPVARMEERL